MCKAFPLRRSLEATLNENLIERRLNFRLILAMRLQISVGLVAETMTRLTGRDVKKLLVSGIPDRVARSRVQTNDKAISVLSSGWSARP
jgi:hypothetical protein